MQFGLWIDRAAFCELSESGLHSGPAMSNVKNGLRVERFVLFFH